MKVLGINAVFHDPAAALVIDGVTVAAAEEERFSRRKHGKPPVAFSTWELPEQSMAWCLAEAGVQPGELDAVAYSYDPDLAFQPNGDITAAEWEGLRTLYARRAPLFLRTALPARDRIVLHLRFVEDLTQAEIADRVGVSQMHVSRLIRRALERLRTVAEHAG